MKFIVDEKSLDCAAEIWLRRAGYAYRPGQNGAPDSFSRRLAGADFPRFHLYLDRQGEKVVFNLHLDQKKPSYPGARAHSGEYDGDLVKGEMSRLKSLMRAA